MFKSVLAAAFPRTCSSWERALHVRVTIPFVHEFSGSLSTLKKDLFHIDEVNDRNSA